MPRPLIRFGLSIPFIVAVVILAFGTGTFLGGKYLVPPGQGLAAPAEAMGYGLLAALIALAIAIFGAMKMPMRILGYSALLGGIATALFGAALTYAFLKANTDRDDDSVTPPARQTSAPIDQRVPPIEESALK